MLRSEAQAHFNNGKNQKKEGQGNQGKFYGYGATVVFAKSPEDGCSAGTGADGRWHGSIFA
ncbi:hypothetical protein [Phyllobacterium sp. 628]|uniref:hypothetical protein n=1 Tax=Phyllobacterium sp. 628 TaxID=2718938 RepID=UPI001FCED80C|nr:hypothetical protein [Phyllobacterium sp. 628]